MNAAAERTELAQAELPATPVACRCADDHCAGSVPQDSLWYRRARYARWLAWVSLAWMTAEGVIGLLAGISSGSIALTGWALGSAIEGLASVIVVWRFTGSRMLSGRAGQQADRAVAVSFWLLAPYIAGQACYDLASQHHAAATRLGIALAASSVVVMPVLGVAKQRLGRALRSAATAGEGLQNLMCAAQAAAVLAGLGVTAAWPAAWPVDAAVALGIAAWSAWAGRQAWRGEGCC
jgi:divalent metal cation (Fe/Co/Zn/Cd) transporter